MVSACAEQWLDSLKCANVRLAVHHSISFRHLHCLRNHNSLLTELRLLKGLLCQQVFWTLSGL